MPDPFSSGFLERMMRSFISHTFTAVVVMAASSVAAAPPSIVTQGNGAALACASCHGVDGAGNPQAGFPVLAQLPPAYFAKQIADFKAGTRTHPVMTPIAQAMSVEDAESAAHHYASQPRPKAGAATVAPAVIARGKNLAINGAWDRQVPPCFKCHAVDGLGVAPAFPAIAGQHAAYTVSQLQAWKTGARTNDPQKLMKAVAENLSDDDIRSVAEYLATLGSRENENE
ncbi:MAG: c-type cytochrome [Thiobacillus sp.]